MAYRLAPNRICERIYTLKAFVTLHRDCLLRSLWLTGPHTPLLIATLIPIADAVIVLHGGSRAITFGVHGGTAVAMLIISGLLLRLMEFEGPRRGQVRRYV
jgi:hypothetical protein